MKKLSGSIGSSDGFLRRDESYLLSQGSIHHHMHPLTYPFPGDLDQLGGTWI